jgi:hypothetical protein
LLQAGSETHDVVTREGPFAPKVNVSSAALRPCIIGSPALASAAKLRELTSWAIRNASG